MIADNNIPLTGIFSDSGRRLFKASVRLDIIHGENEPPYEVQIYRPPIQPQLFRRLDTVVQAFDLIAGRENQLRIPA